MPSRTQTFALAVADLTASACLPCDLHAQSTAVLDAEIDASTLPPIDAPTWSGVIGMEGQMTGDGRLIEPNALRWEDLPIPLRFTPEDNGSHEGAVTVGWVTDIARSGSEIKANGTFDVGSPMGVEALRQVQTGLSTGISMDLDDVSFEVRVAAELAEDMLFFPLFAQGPPPPPPAGGGDGAPEDVAPEDQPICDENDPAYDPEACQAAKDEAAGPGGTQESSIDGSEQVIDEDGRVTMMEVHSDDEVRVTTSARIRAATIVAIPAFAEAKISADAPAEAAEAAVVAEAEAIVAAGALTDPPAAWFTAPLLSGPTALTITDEGRIYGHLATWGTCHIAHPKTCVSPPRSASNYAYFRTGLLRTREGSDVAVGHVTLDTRHADTVRLLSAAQAQAHYENTGSVVADVAVGEDSYGIWVSGAVRPHLTEAQMRSLRSAPLSGDWREVRGALELVAALAVNVPGFPIPRPAGLVASGRLASLVASGMVPPARVIPPGLPGALSLDDLRYLQRLVAREREAERIHLVAAATDPADLRRRVTASALARRAHVRV